MQKNEQLVLDYAHQTVDNPLACLDTRAAARRFLNDLEAGTQRTCSRSLDTE